MKNTVICCSRDVMGGAPVFCETRVPVKTLLDYLEAGDSIDEFLAGFPVGHLRASGRVSRSGEGSAGRNGVIKVFLDECVDWRLSRDLIGHEVSSRRAGELSVTRRHVQGCEGQFGGRRCDFPSCAC
jgi:hypothetical protein